MPDERTSAVRRIRASLIGAALLLIFDAIISGSFLLSMFVCPIWFLISVVKNIIRRSGWKVTLARIAVPILALALVFGNAAVQSRIATTNADRIIKACEQFTAANGRYPTKLDELLPQYLRSVPRAKYSVAFAEFSYWSLEGRHGLMWIAIPPFSRMIYNFEQRKWGKLD
jgi:hypothetical protein